ncbi:hypothetical protein Pcinc_028708 [Petrolisthes cinctipes]|uniref:Uncharacterized protein n=1 Tax=Petrolisthes cinctipes TaxID=88211 RepID=A0AAE1F343_PETCI|nr:hypothetical protein Pcinc_028708 [Petrolisthes cinctipes]
MPDSTPEPAASRPQEIPLTLTFGDETSPAAFRAFNTHYALVKDANIMRGVAVWTKTDYRAFMLRLQLHGLTAAYVEQEAQLDAEWGKDDTRILERLSSRFITADAIEIRILHFEEATQLSGEGLSIFMTRLQQLAGQAFAKEPGDIVRKRVIWRFLDGIRDKEVRLHIIKEKWMEDDEEANAYATVLKMTESALSTKNATFATGQMRGTPGGGNMAQVVAEQADNHETVVSTHEPPRAVAVARRTVPPAPNSRTPPTQGYRGSTIGQGASSAVECYYCSRAHRGGWRSCYKRLRENPAWRPGSSRQDFH